MPEKIIQGIEEILYSGQLSFGKYGKLFEEKLKNYIGCEYLLSVSSYNQAMLIILSTLNLKQGDEVIASPVSCLASNQPFAVKGLKVIWADINPETGSISPNDVRSKITKKTKAIFHNHFCGYVGEIDEINKIGLDFGIPIIDDCIEAFGAEFKGNKLGNVGTDITVFSFQTVRLPNTIDGGALVFKDEALFEKAKLIRDYGIDRSNFRTSLGEINPNCDIKLEGYAGLMSEVNSYIGIHQMKDIQNLIDQQKSNAKIWDLKFETNKPVKGLAKNKNSIPNYWVYGVLCENKDASIKQFRDEGYYATGVHLNNNVYSVFNNCCTLKGVNDFMNRFLAIPCGWWFNNK